MNKSEVVAKIEELKASISKTEEAFFIGGL